jgi:hypothetical protein
MSRSNDASSRGIHRKRIIHTFAMTEHPETPSARALMRSSPANIRKVLNSAQSLPLPLPLPLPLDVENELIRNIR